jgi:hypothetical protein
MVVARTLAYYYTITIMTINSFKVKPQSRSKKLYLPWLLGQQLGLFLCIVSTPKEPRQVASMTGALLVVNYFLFVLACQSGAPYITPL